MPTPSERLKKIIESVTPSEVVFKAKNVGDIVSLIVTVTKPLERKQLTEDTELQEALSREVEEHWDGDQGKYYISASIESLWGKIKHAVIYEYERVSDRCAATQKKTEQFIHSIKIDDKHLPNYLLQVFLNIQSKKYSAMTRLDRKDLFEQFESLRRTYGKRSR